MTTALVTGAGGFIGGHLVRSLLANGHEVRAVDIKPQSEWYQVFGDAENVSGPVAGDLSVATNCVRVCEGVDDVYNLAADMGGMGYLDAERVATLHSVDITSNMIKAAYNADSLRYFQASSACVYPDFKQQTPIVSLKESDAWPADPEPCYGLEKLVGEQFCKWYAIQRGYSTRAARLHNVYGEMGTFDGGREKAPAAACRKVATAVFNGDSSVEIWGDGEQTRSFMYVDDCIEGIHRLMASDVREPINLGSSELVSINELYRVVMDIAGVDLELVHVPGPLGVRGRNSDNTMILRELGWQPETSLRAGLEKTYAWVYDQVIASRQRVSE